MTIQPVYAPPPGPPPSHQHSEYAPPPGPPPTWYPQAFLPATFPLLDSAQIHSLSSQGFTTFPISQRQALNDAALALFNVSRTFFAQPQPNKLQFQVRNANAQGSEEGWSRVIGEKELLTIRRGGATCPLSAESEGRTMWRECGTLMQEVIRGVEQSLGMPQYSLDAVVSPECTMPEDGAERLETLLRMFRYERRSEADDHAAHHDEDATGKGRLVSESHRDLGLLSLVIGSSPGLEVWDTVSEAWIPIEEPPYATPGLTATLLVGDTLALLTNGRYTPGRHRVFVPSIPSSQSFSEESQFRYSLVFALRPHANAIISTTALTTPITGFFQRPLEGVRARELFTTIARSRWNVNTAHKERDAQRLRIQGASPKTPSVSEAGQDNNRCQAAVEANPQDAPVSQNVSPKKKRWSLPIFHSSPILPKSETSRSTRRSIFQRISGR